MDAKELRIGNLVKISERSREELFDCNEIVTNTDTFKVAAISEDIINLWINICTSVTEFILWFKGKGT